MSEMDGRDCGSELEMQPLKEEIAIIKERVELLEKMASPRVSHIPREAYVGTHEVGSMEYM